jgi:hypothetical protein
MIPVDDVGTTSAKLRIEECGNYQKKNIHWAVDYEIPQDSLIPLRL